MKYNPDAHKRRSIRLKNYDYSSEGLYFITISSQDKLCLFGDIKNGKLNLFDSGKMIGNEWIKLGNRFEYIKLYSFVVMPNHFHGIIENVGAIPCGCPDNVNLPDKGNTLGDIIGGFKSITTNEYIKNVRNNDWQPFNKKLWQRNYYEHIIRNEESYNTICEYIENNHLKWDEDKFYYVEAF